MALAALFLISVLILFLVLSVLLVAVTQGINLLLVVVVLALLGVLVAVAIVTQAPEVRELSVKAMQVALVMRQGILLAGVEVQERLV